MHKSGSVSKLVVYLEATFEINYFLILLFKNAFNINNIQHSIFGHNESLNTALPYHHLTDCISFYIL